MGFFGLSIGCSGEVFDGLEVRKGRSEAEAAAVRAAPKPSCSRPLASPTFDASQAVLEVRKVAHSSSLGASLKPLASLLPSDLGSDSREESRAVQRPRGCQAGSCCRSPSRWVSETVAAVRTTRPPKIPPGRDRRMRQARVVAASRTTAALQPCPHDSDCRPPRPRNEVDLIITRRWGFGRAIGIAWFSVWGRAGRLTAGTQATFKPGAESRLWPYDEVLAGEQPGRPVALRRATTEDQGFCCGYCFSPQKGQESDRACSGFRQCQQKPFLGTSRAFRRLRMSSSSVALWSMSAAVARSSSSSEARW